MIYSEIDFCRAVCDVLVDAYDPDKEIEDESKELYIEDTYKPETIGEVIWDVTNAIIDRMDDYMYLKVLHYPNKRAYNNMSPDSGLICYDDCWKVMNFKTYMPENAFEPFSRGGRMELLRQLTKVFYHPDEYRVVVRTYFPDEDDKQFYYYFDADDTPIMVNLKLTPEEAEKHETALQEEMKKHDELTKKIQKALEPLKKEYAKIQQLHSMKNSFDWD